MIFDKPNSSSVTNSIIKVIHIKSFSIDILTIKVEIKPIKPIPININPFKFFLFIITTLDFSSKIIAQFLEKINNYDIFIKTFVGEIWSK